MSLKLKTILGVAFIEAILLALLITLTMNYLKSTNYDGLEKRAHTTVNLFASTTKDAVLSYDLASLDAFSSELLTNPDIEYVRILSYDNQLLASAGNSQLLTKAYIPDNNVEMVNDGIFDTDALIREGGETYGRIELGLNTAELNRQIDQVQQWSLSIALGEMSLVALFSFLLGSYLISQLSKLRQAAMAISDGQSDVVIDVQGKDEVAQVAVAFNQMSERLQDAAARRDLYEQELLELNRSLESRVQRRTAQLSENVEQLRQANQSLRNAQERLIQTEKLASLGTMAAGVAHEINNPVGFIISNIHTLKHYAEIYDQAIEQIQQLTHQTDPSMQNAELEKLKHWLEQQDMAFVQQDISELINDTMEGSERIREIVAGLRNFSSNQREKNYQLCDLNSIINQTLKLANRKLAQHAEVITDLHETSPVMCHAGQMQQVLFNLMINAGQAIEENSSGKIKIRSGQTEQYVFVSVTDNGCGIDQETQKQIFDPFFTTKPVGKGTGLGLSIAYGIVEEHNGQIQLQSAIGKGTRFTVYLPIVNLSTERSNQEAKRA